MGVCSSAEPVREPPLFDLTMERLERRAAVYEIKYGADCEDCYDIIAQWLEEVDIDGSAPIQDIPPSPEQDSKARNHRAAGHQNPSLTEWGVFEDPLHGSATSVASSDHSSEEQTGSRDALTRFDASPH